MKVIMDLIEAYSDHVGLPLNIVDIEGEIKQNVDSQGYLSSIHESSNNLLMLKQTAKQVIKPTLISVSDSNHPCGSLYIVTPVFKVNKRKIFLIAGPFIVNPCIDIHNKNLINDEIKEVYEIDIEDIVLKMENLYLLIENKSKVEERYLIPDNIMEIIQSIDDLDQQHIDYNQYIKVFLDEYLDIDNFDFLGFALKNSDDVFVVKHISGQKVKHIEQKKFYIGEGLLGKAAILGEDFYWSKGIDTQRTEFLNRHGIFPSHLFGMTIKQNKNVEGIIFGGNLNDQIISEISLKILRYIVDLIMKKIKNNVKMLDSYYIKSIFANWLDLLEVTNSVQDKKYVSYMVLDFCQTLNNEKFSCFSSIDYELVYRGQMNPKLVNRHQQLFAQHIHKSHDKIWLENNCIHFYLSVHNETYSLFSVEFDQDADVQLALYILGIVEDLISNNLNRINSLNYVKDNSIFELLYSGMREMNSVQYQQTNIAIDVVNKIVDTLQLDYKKRQLMINICKVCCFSNEYLSTYIAHTEEWSMIQSVMKLIQSKTIDENISIEIKILGYIYEIVHYKDKRKDFEFLSTELKVMCTSIYKSIATSDLYAEELDHEQIEKITDLKSVIETLALTSREKEVLYLILEGLNNQEVGQYLKISVHTVKNHVTNIFKKLNVSDRIQAMSKIYRIKFGEV